MNLLQGTDMTGQRPEQEPRPQTFTQQILSGPQVISSEIQIRLGLKDRFDALEAARRKGISPEELIALGSFEEKPDSGYRNQLKWAGIAIAGATGVAIVGENWIPDFHLGPFALEYFRGILDKGGYTLVNDSLKELIKGMGITGAGYSTFLLGVVVVANAAKERFASTDRKRRVYEYRREVDDLKNRGKLRLDMNEGFVAIDLGTDGDAVGRSLGSRLGWGRNTLPLMEGSENHSGYDVWASIPNPSNGVEKRDFFEALDRIHFKKASTFVLCPVNHNQAFIPDIRNPRHFDLGFDEIVDRIRLILEYAQMNEMGKKKIVVIGDGTLERAVGAYSDSGHSETERHTLKQTLEDLSAQTGWEIILADPTEIVLDKLTSEEYNPEGLPLQFYEDPNATETYGRRFVDKVEEFARRHPERNIRVKKDDTPERTLHVIYGVDDIATRETTMLNSNDYDHTVAIIIDEARAVGGPYKSIILSNAVSDWVRERLRIPQETAAA